MGSGSISGNLAKSERSLSRGAQKIGECGKNNCNVNGKCVFFLSFFFFKWNTQDRNYKMEIKTEKFCCGEDEK